MKERSVECEERAPMAYSANPTHYRLHVQRQSPFGVRLVSAVLLTMCLVSSLVFRSTVIAAPLPVHVQRFHGNCFTYRAAMWRLAQQSSQLISLWWQDIRLAYGGRYPEVRSTTDLTFAAAYMFEIQFYLNLDHTRLSPASYQQENIGTLFGVTDSITGDPYDWSYFQLEMTNVALSVAAAQETYKTASGLIDYHESQRYMRYTWEALKQLPCRS